MVRGTRFELVTPTMSTRCSVISLDLYPYIFGLKTKIYRIFDISSYPIIY